MPGRLQLLLVDDEPFVLEGLCRQLHPLRDRWELSLALGGTAALRRIAERRFDVVVSDMRMVGTDGAAVLAAVAQVQPQASRFILSGFSEREDELRCLGPAQRWLRKPCDAGCLSQAVERSQRLHAELAQPAVTAALAAMDDLLLLPESLRDLLCELSTADPSVQRAVGLLVGNPQLGIAAALLAAMAGLIPHAAALPGTEMLAGIPPGILRGLVLAAHLQTCCGPDQEEVWEHGLLVGSLAGRILAGHPTSTRDQAETAGVLHDGGRLILASLGAGPRARLVQARARGLRLEDAEREVYGCDHASLGAALLARWGLPDPLVEAVAWHHRPAGGGLDGALAVHLADALGGAADAAILDVSRVAGAGLEGRLDGWRAMAAAASGTSRRM